MSIPTEPIGSVPRPRQLIDAVSKADGIPVSELNRLNEQALRDTIDEFEATGSPMIIDGEQTKPSFATYPLSGSKTSPLTGWRSRSRTATSDSCRASRQAPSAM